MWQLLPQTALLLLVSAGLQADLPKAVVSLVPPWDRVLQEDSVTLQCKGEHPPGNKSTKWFHNGNLLSNEDSSYFIADARVEHSGEYRCRTNLSTLSDPVQLEVHEGWLLLQSLKREYKVGENIHLRCHTWKNNFMHKVTYLQNGRGKRYFHENSDLHIQEATANDGGLYFCRGLIGKKNISSETVNITIRGSISPPISALLPWHQVTFFLVLMLLFAVDTGLYVSVQRNLQNSSRNWKDHKFKWNKDPLSK
ncbi:low affinity immunoglobulin gamma Fc region receptor III-A-like isoform X2 [Nycticebus coucang]|uniref:low affinity immunoglobulin gamma Fc region receptor III-A-like isoform X2 n=1 Tax=Nycticebus coucang TaxID=9470 RepID=UPI00234D32BA|nr:low affinity immunoglobulin gamma Fc region receptor III-A-like isoform X2 [Nycticebus coucang]